VTDVVEGEVVSPEEFARSFRPRAVVVESARLAGSDVVTVARVTRRAISHDRTRAVCREIAYIPGGVRAGWSYYRQNYTSARYITQIDAAYASGDMERAERLTAAMEAERGRRWSRLVDVVKLLVQAVKVLPWLALIAVFGLLGFGILLAVGGKDASLVLAPFRWIVAGVALAIWLFTISAAVLPWALCGLVVLCLWAAGRRAGNVPEFLAPAAEREARREEITPALAVMAFRDLGIAELRKRILALPDNGAPMISQIRPAGCGVEFDATPPRGSTSTAVILSRHDRLSENINRHPHEVHLSVPQNQPGTVRVWAADPGALDEPIGASPLVYDDEIKADYRRGAAPWGMTLRNDPAEIRLYQIHLLITGKSNQGKTASLRALALWLALDKRPELRIADLKGMNPTTKRSDWAMFEGIATEFIAGPTDDHVAEATEMLERVVAEMNRRIQRGGNWDPLIAIVDEAQVAYMCPAKGPDGRPYGGSKNTSRFLTAVRQIQNQGRAVDVLLWEGTQDPTNQNLPILAREGAHLRICLAVGTEEKSRMALGDNAVEGGAAPHRLRPGLDKGTVVVAGDGAPLSAGQASVTIRTHFIDDKDATAIANRAKKLRGPLVPRPPEEERDLLEDVFELMGDAEQVPAATMARLLHPVDRRYAVMDGVQLKARLDDLGALVTKNKGVPMVYRSRIQAAMESRGEGA
jgi:S-DNA-T family DNA segregation ATPase FtsK/SpoIIIE